MFPAHIANYKAVQIRTSSPGDILLALYDGLFKFLYVARRAIPAGDLVKAREAISRALAIVGELYSSLDVSQHPELCKNLSLLYDYSLRRLMHAARVAEVQGIEDVIRVLTPVREANQVAVRQFAAEGSSAARGAAR